ncbi:MAG: sulfotransferase [Burkholderiales bacterium]|nr:sulfotransferase [Burkholderiales bacterium]
MSTTVDTALLEAKEAERTKTVADALTILRDANKKHPNNDKVEFEMARMLEKAKSWNQALVHYQRIAQRHEKMPPDVALGSARSLLGLKKFDKAEQLFTALKEKAPNREKEVRLGLATLARHKKDFKAAEEHVKAVLKADPNSMAARHELAEIILAADPKDTKGQAQQILEKNIDREDLHGDSLDRWMVFMKESKRDKYLKEKLEGWTQKYPKRVEFLFGYGLACNRAGEITIARPTLQKALELLPNNGKILYELGLVERVAGNIELSQQLIGKALEQRWDFPAGLRTFGVDHKYAYGDEQFKRVNRAAANLSDMPPEDQVQMHFALGKAFDDVGELDASFAHYAIGGSKKRKLENYNEKNNARLFGLLQKLLNKDLFDKNTQRGFEDETPTFILGMPRSGTSLMEQILSAHPDIFGAGELKLMTSVLENIQVGQARLRMGDVEAAFPYDQNAGYEDRGKAYVERLRRLAPAGRDYKRIVDKMPGNFNFVGLIHLILPNAKIIHSRRHPVETCLSCYRIHFAEGHQWTYNQRELGRYYKRYWNLMKHWRESLPGVMYEARYEDNVADVEGSAKNLISYLGLPWDDNCLNFYNVDRPVKTASASQVRKPIYTTSTNRWRKYEKYLGPLLEEIGDLVEEYERELESPAVNPA